MRFHVAVLVRFDDAVRGEFDQPDLCCSQRWPAGTMTTHPPMPQCFLARGMVTSLTGK